jgi:hypothetical protein
VSILRGAAAVIRVNSRRDPCKESSLLEGSRRLRAVSAGDVLGVVGETNMTCITAEA